jgi:uncharacterized membrane protein
MKRENAGLLALCIVVTLCWFVFVGAMFAAPLLVAYGYATPLGLVYTMAASGLIGAVAAYVADQLP